MICPYCLSEMEPCFALSDDEIRQMTYQARRNIGQDAVLVEFASGIHNNIALPAQQLVLDNDIEAAKALLETLGLEKDVVWKNGSWFYRIQTQAGTNSRVLTKACSECHHILPEHCEEELILHPVMMLGLPEAGKTCSLVSLKMATESLSDYSVVNHGFSYDGKHFNSMCEKLRSGYVPDSTPNHSEAVSNRQPPLLIQHGKQLVTLTDLPGEYFLDKDGAFLDANSSILMMVPVDAATFTEDFSALMELVQTYKHRVQRFILNFTAADKLGGESLHTFMLDAAESAEAYRDLRATRRKFMMQRLTSPYREAAKRFLDATEDGTILFTAPIGCGSMNGQLTGELNPRYMDDMLYELFC